MGINFFHLGSNYVKINLISDTFSRFSHIYSDCLSLKYSDKHTDEAVNTFQKNHKHKGRQETQDKRMKDIIQLDVQLTC